jgi:hypothetical protein
MEEILNNIVSRIILPKFPWIEDFKWYKNYSRDSNKNYWSLKVIPASDLSVPDAIMNTMRMDVYKEMNSLFKMLGLPENEQFHTVIVQ